VIRIWSNILSTHPATIKKKMDWYLKQQEQTTLDKYTEKEDYGKNTDD